MITLFSLSEWVQALGLLHWPEEPELRALAAAVRGSGMPESAAHRSRSSQTAGW